ncbi:MAG: hypothetical protein WD049_02700 [Candidatus Paceibacterota bacterium]
MSNAIIQSVDIQTAPDNGGSSLLAATVTTADGSATHSTATADGISLTPKSVQDLALKITNSLLGIDAAHQQEVDSILVQITETHEPGPATNAVLNTVSGATAVTAAQITQTPLHQHLRALANTNGGTAVPRIYASLISGGPRNTSPLSFNALSIIPETDNAERARKVIRDIKTALGTVLRTQTQEDELPVGRDGAFSPRTIEFNQAGLEMLLEGVAEAFPEVKIRLAIDAGGPQVFQDDAYHIDQQKLSATQLQGYYDYLIERFHIHSIQDPFDRSTLDQFQAMRQRHPDLEIVGGELVREGIDQLHQAHDKAGISAVSIVPTDARTLSETLTLIRAAHDASLHCIISHGQNETPTSLSADLAVGCGCSGLRPGAPGTPGNDATYERLIEITHHESN